MKAWLDDSAAYHRNDTADLERGAWKDRQAEARQHYEQVGQEIVRLQALIDQWEGLSASRNSAIGHAPPHLYSQLGALFAERNALDDELEDYE